MLLHTCQHTQASLSLTRHLQCCKRDCLTWPCPDQACVMQADSKHCEYCQCTVPGPLTTSLSLSLSTTFLRLRESADDPLPALALPVDRCPGLLAADCELRLEGVEAFFEAAAVAGGTSGFAAAAGRSGTGLTSCIMHHKHAEVLCGSLLQRTLG